MITQKQYNDPRTTLKSYATGIQHQIGIRRGRVLNKELYKHRIKTLIYLHLSTELLRKYFSSLIRTNTGI